MKKFEGNLANNYIYHNRKYYKTSNKTYSKFNNNYCKKNWLKNHSKLNETPSNSI